MLTGKSAKVEELFDEKTLEAASKRFRGGIGLQELLLEVGRSSCAPRTIARSEVPEPRRMQRRKGLKHAARVAWANLFARARRERVPRLCEQ